MKKSTLFTISILIMLFGMLFAVGDVVALDAPHNTNDVNRSITCSACHVSPAGPTPTWKTLPTTTDNTYVNNLCTSCHQAGKLTTSKYEDIKTHSAANTSSVRWSGQWTVECKVCHHPHFQVQQSVNLSDGTANVLTGTVGALSSSVSATMSTLTTSGTPTMTTDQYVGYLLVPNTAYPSFMYRIMANDGTKFTVKGAINLGRAFAGKTFAVRYGKMVKSSVSYPFKGIAATVKFQNSSGPASFASGSNSSASVCMVCHTLTKYFKNDGTLEASGHPSGVAGTNCMSCHAHNTGFKAGGCTGCHGSPPVNAATLVYGSANGNDPAKQTGAVSAGAHVMHAVTLNYSCETCHANAMPATPIPDNMIQMGFTSPDGNGGTYTTRGALINGYTYTRGNAQTTLLAPGTAMQCSNLYCHSSGQSATGGTPPTYKTPTWTGAVVCGDCHNADGVNGTKTLMATGSHTKHVSTTAGTGYNIACDTCHQGAGTNTTVHGNYVIEVAFDAAKAGTGSYNGSNTSPGNHAPGQGFGTCSTTFCHGNFTGGTVANTAVWGNAASGACGTCHNATTTTPPTSGAHAKHATSPGYKFGCELCHNTVTTNGTSITAAANHANMATNWGLSNSDSRIGSGALYKGSNSGSNSTVGTNINGSCASLYCHSQGTSPLGAPNTPPTWQAGALTCDDCHGGSKADPIIISSGSHSAHVNSNQGCDYCHNATTTTGTTITNTANHVNKLVNISFSSLNTGGKVNNTVVSTPSSTYKAPGATPTIQCSATYCHGAGTPTWNTDNNTLNCASCHKANSTLAGKHAVHYGVTTTATTASKTAGNSSTTSAYVFSCGVCHENTAHATGKAGTYQAANVAFNATMVGAGASYTAGTPSAGNDGGYDWTSGTCAATNCHSNGKVGTGVFSAASPTWNGTALGCKGCHGTGNSAGAPDYATGGGGTVTANTHTQHVIGNSITCDKCHYGTTTTGNTITDKTKHVNASTSTGQETADVTFPASVGPSASYAYGTGNKTCATTYCHGGSSPKWGANTADAGCVKCHGVAGATPAQYAADNNIAAPGYVSTSPTGTGRSTSGATLPTDAKVGAHNAHLKASSNYSSPIACIACHDTATGHMNGSGTLIFSGLATSNGATSAAYTAPNCDNTYCHFGKSIQGYSAATTSARVSWTNTTLLTGTTTTTGDCGKCHMSPPSTTGAHNGITTISQCNGCHNHVNTNGTFNDVTKHINGFVDGGACNSCHGYPPNPSDGKQARTTDGQGKGAHQQHVDHLIAQARVILSNPTFTLNPTGDQFGSGNSWTYVCGVCHNGAVHTTSETIPGTGRTINTPTTYQFGSSVPVYNGTVGVSSLTTPKTCSNVSCHFKTTPVWSAY